MGFIFFSSSLFSSNEGFFCWVGVVLNDAFLNMHSVALSLLISLDVSFKQICERLGIELKRSHIRLINLCYRFGMKVQEEQYLKSKTIRVWTSRNFNPEPEVAFIHKLDEKKSLDQRVPGSSSNISEFEASTFNGELVDSAKLEDVGTGAKLSCVSPKNVESNHGEMPTNLQGLALDQRGTVSHSKQASLSVEADVALSRAFPSDVLIPFSTGSYPRRASLSFTADSTRRANKILEKLKVFVIFCLPNFIADEAIAYCLKNFIFCF